MYKQPYVKLAITIKLDGREKNTRSERDFSCTQRLRIGVLVKSAAAGQGRATASHVRPRFWVIRLRDDSKTWDSTCELLDKFWHSGNFDVWKIRRQSVWISLVFLVLLKKRISLLFGFLFVAWICEFGRSSLRWFVQFAFEYIHDSRGNMHSRKDPITFVRDLLNH